MSSRRGSRSSGAVLGGALALVLALLAGGAQAATVQRLSLGQLAALSERVFIGTVAAQQSRLSEAPRQVLTDTTFTVEQVLKGPKESGPFVLTRLGGEVGEGASLMRQAISGYPRFEVGERVVLFLERTPGGALVITGLAQGKFTVRDDAKTGRPMAVRDVSDLAFVGQVVPTRTFLGVPSDPNRLPLDQIVTVARGGRPLASPMLHQAPATPQVSLPAGGAR